PNSVDLTREQLVEIFPILDTFLADAEEFWGFSQSVLLDSGPWTQSDVSGTPWTLHALTFTAASERFLLLSVPGAQFEESRAIIQRARNQSLVHHRMERQVSELESHSREIENLHRFKGELLNVLSRELRAPLNDIIDFSTTLAEERAGNLNQHQNSLVE